MSFDEFFTDGDKPYAENLNDSLALIDAFDVTVPAEMPTMFNNGEFNSTVNVTRKCGVALVTLKSVASGVTVGTSSISGTGDIVFRVYPNFNSFYKWSKIILEKTGTVSIAFRKTDGTSISATVGSDGTISETGALKQLQEIDVVLTLTNANITDILIEFVNNHTAGRTRTGALLEASQLVNVDGQVVSGETKAVNGDVVYDAVHDVDNRLAVNISQLSYTKKNKSDMVTTLNNSSTQFPSCSAVKEVTDNRAKAVHQHTISQITDLLSTLYPVGSIYMSMNANMPTAIANLGTWTKIQGKVLLASGEIPIPWLENQRLLLVAGDTGGEFWHQLTIDEMPSHTHEQDPHYHKMYGKYRTGTTEPLILNFNLNFCPIFLLNVLFFILYPSLFPIQIPTLVFFVLGSELIEVNLNVLFTSIIAFPSPI